MIEQFKKDVKSGLESYPKTLPSKYFYDEIGDQLFIKIMNLPEYYLTNCEMEIFRVKTIELISKLGLELNRPFDLIELGAGDGAKTIHLLKRLVSEGYDFNYHPVDISKNALDGLESNLNKEIPKLAITKQQGDYFNILSKLKDTERQKVILFLGSNIGNFVDDKAHLFLKSASEFMNAQDRLLIGTDLIKSKEIVLPAYSDSQGVTAAFNVNLLTRINREMDADFNLPQFEHLATYEESEGIARSYMVSKTDQTVAIKALDLKISFKAGERIHTEISRKYTDEILSNILQKTDLEIDTKIMDSRHYFADFILKKT